jgi:tetratricopeptide (TPR) repeat protein
MRIIALVTLFLLILIPLCIADDAVIKEAYSLYYQGKTDEAIRSMEEYVSKYPDPHALYFLGYLYYELKRLDKAIKYFNDAYLIDPYFVPKKTKVKEKGLEILKEH